MQGQHGFFISSTDQPDYVVSSWVDDATVPGNMKIDTYKIDRFYRDIQTMASVFCKPLGENDMYQIGTVYKQLFTFTGTTTVYWYLMHVGHLLWGWPYGDPKEGGYWTFDPPIADRLSQLNINLGIC